MGVVCRAFSARLTVLLAPRRIVHVYLLAIAGGLSVVSICRLCGFRSGISILAEMASISAVLLSERRHLWPIGLTGMFACVLLYAMLLGATWRLFPAFPLDWNWGRLSGFLLVGVPVEELIWAAGYGGTWSLLMGYAFDARFEVRSQ